MTNLLLLLPLVAFNPAIEIPPAPTVVIAVDASHGWTGGCGERAAYKRTVNRVTRQENAKGNQVRIIRIDEGTDLRGLPSSIIYVAPSC
jgi:hypothetical protein